MNKDLFDMMCLSVRGGVVRVAYTGSAVEQYVSTFSICMCYRLYHNHFI